MTEHVRISAVDFQLARFDGVAEEVDSMQKEATLVDFKFNSGVLQRHEYLVKISDVFLTVFLSR